MIVNTKATAPATTVANAPVTIVPFDKLAQEIKAAFGKGDKATLALLAKLKALEESKAATIRRVMQQYVDLNFQANGRTQAACKALSKGILSSEIVQRTIEMKQIEKTTWTEYAKSAERALYWGLDFKQSLKNEPDLILPWDKALAEKKAATKAASNPTQAGAVINTNRAELDKTLSKALQQMRLISLEGIAADLLDFLQERLADFQEIKAK